jgi:predicted nuclease of predicted toxin-antitoxin system
MRVLADENVPGPLVRTLRSRGHDVIWMRERAPGATDSSVLEVARSEARLLVTFDKDFGELAFRVGLPASCGIVLVRLTGTGPSGDNERAVAALESRDDWTGNFAVITDRRIRIRPLALLG